MITIKELKDKYSHYTRLNNTILHIYNLTRCIHCYSLIMTKENEYLESSGATIASLSMLLRHAKFIELDDTPPEVEWFGDIQLAECDHCHES